MSRICCPNAASMSRMKRSAAGRLSLAWPMPENSDARTRVLIRVGISMKSSSRSTARTYTCGAPLIARERSPGRAGAIAPKQASSLEADAETAQVTRLLARRRHDRRTSIIWRGIERTWDESSPHNRRSDQQPGREFSSPGAAARTTYAALQVRRFSATIPLHTCSDLSRLQRSTPSDLAQNIAPVPN